MPGERHWKESLVMLADEEQFTVDDAAGILEITRPAAAQLIARLAERGLARVVGFEDPVHENARRRGTRQGIGGRRRKVYEVTEAGQKKAQWIEEQGKKV